ncbi:uncharacterized protein G2W53_008310 [Senna tora]|uniref:Uncharacterized protein n=1 Tax=Senna tora TaxID=362788 RepID=A0A834X6S4_9FABA|nr:uncharacterized protein G2W53_008310 [Senna tora]
MSEKKAPRKVQDPEPDGTKLSTEERDNLDRSNKKVKRDVAAGETPDHTMAEVSVSPLTADMTSKAQEQGEKDMVDLSMEEVRNEEIDPDKVKRAIWKDQPERNLTYKERLMGFNGRKEGHLTNKKEEEESKNEGKEKPAQNHFMSDNRQAVVGEEAFGPWMHVQRNIRRRTRFNQNNNRSPPQNYEQNNGSRFQVIAQDEGLDQMEVDHNQNQMVVYEDQSPQNQQGIENVQNESQSPSKSKGVKIKQKKMETPVSSNRKVGGGTQGNQEHKKQAKSPSDKANDHVVVTSPGIIRKQQPTGVQGKSPSKPIEQANKVPTKNNTNSEITRPKQRKPPDDKEYEEQLRLMKITENELRAAGTLLSGLGITQVTDNRL